MSNSFTQKILQVSLTLAHGSFNSARDNTKILKGFRVECDITKGGHPSKNKALVKIYGMTQDDMNALTFLTFQGLATDKNLIQVMAGDENGLAVAFKGEITSAYAKYSSPPNLFFHIEAMSGYYPSIVPVVPTSYKGAVSVSSVMAKLAQDMGYSFEDNGVKSYIVNQVLPGSSFQKAALIAAAADIEFGIDDGVLFIAPLNQARKGNAPLISPSTGMKEYPIFDKKGIKVSSLYNPAVLLGGLIVVQDSAVKKANGTWRVNGLKHTLEAEKPGGRWETHISAGNVDALPTTPGTADEEGIV